MSRLTIGQTVTVQGMTAMVVAVPGPQTVVLQLLQAVPPRRERRRQRRARDREQRQQSKQQAGRQAQAVTGEVDA